MTWVELPVSQRALAIGFVGRDYVEAACCVCGANFRFNAFNILCGPPRRPPADARICTHEPLQVRVPWLPCGRFKILRRITLNGGSG